jgi:hypothetical protein
MVHIGSVHDTDLEALKAAASAGAASPLAVFDRRRVGVAIYSPHAVITTGRRGGAR